MADGANSTKGCPVKHDHNASSASPECPYKDLNNEESGMSSSPMSWFFSAIAPTRPSTSPAPFSVPKEDETKAGRIVASMEESANHPQTRIYPEQKIPLNDYRVTSSIPRADELLEDEGLEVPKHQDKANTESKYWMYPSEQQFYNAMARKGWDPKAEDMRLVVAIHNAVNERGWYEVQRWEKELHGTNHPRLVRFMGRPNDTSPKAWINSNFLGYKPPFDRHDWYVERNGKPVRYVVDFYNGNNKDNTSGGASPGFDRSSMYLDVRPALDDPMAFVDRVRMAARETFPGLFAASRQQLSGKKTDEHGEGRRNY